MAAACTEAFFAHENREMLTMLAYTLLTNIILLTISLESNSQVIVTVPRKAKLMARGAQWSR